MDLKLLDERLAARGEPGFRARQVWEWTARGAESYEPMSNLPQELRTALAGEVPFSSLAAGARGRGQRRHAKGAPHHRPTGARWRRC